MDALDQLYRFLDKAEQDMAATERQLGSFRDAEPELAALVGEGRGADGWIRVTWTQQGLQDLEIDPRALRQPSEIVSREIKAAIAEASQDLSAKTLDLIEGLGIRAPEAPSPQEAQAQLGEMREQMMGAFRASASELDRVALLQQRYHDPRRADRG
ncbi:YbaB/EbfC family nucleoid-associated protein [Nocardioides litoris]|uniref:YbaB/EbfC family nucleoid-associated protein n=1 Tax=Nocardioides litoris TaxID=1926648 RepID=UPI00147757AA|nr:YbaB/EbfC family nucleoid-associated protein [Nocardioides litoris]